MSHEKKSFGYEFHWSPGWFSWDSYNGIEETLLRKGSITNPLYNLNNQVFFHGSHGSDFPNRDMWLLHFSLSWSVEYWGIISVKFDLTWCVTKTVYLHLVIASMMHDMLNQCCLFGLSLSFIYTHFQIHIPWKSSPPLKKSLPELMK